jgi:hypothetical protein
LRFDKYAFHKSMIPSYWLTWLPSQCRKSHLGRKYPCCITLGRPLLIKWHSSTVALWSWCLFSPFYSGTSLGCGL